MKNRLEKHLEKLESSKGDDISYLALVGSLVLGLILMTGYLVYTLIFG